MYSSISIILNFYNKILNYILLVTYVTLKQNINIVFYAYMNISFIKLKRNLVVFLNINIFIKKGFDHYRSTVSLILLCEHDLCWSTVSLKSSFDCLFAPCQDPRSLRCISASFNRDTLVSTYNGNQEHKMRVFSSRPKEKEGKIMVIFSTDCL